jgi:hypothetical protein
MTYLYFLSLIFLFSVWQEGDLLIFKGAGGGGGQFQRQLKSRDLLEVKCSDDS